MIGKIIFYKLEDKKADLAFFEKRKAYFIRINAEKTFSFAMADLGAAVATLKIAIFESILEKFFK